MPRSAIGASFKIQDDDAALELIRGMAKIHCTKAELAAVMGVSRQTLDDYFKRVPAAAEMFEQGPDIGKLSLRRRQYQAVMAGDTKMMIHLGKNWLGQHSGDIKISGKIEHQHTIMHTLLGEIDENMRRAEQARVAGLLPAPAGDQGG